MGHMDVDVPLKRCSLRYGMIYRSQLVFSERNQSLFSAERGRRCR